MSISISDYLNSTYQSTQTSSAEKVSQKDSEAEAGKTKQSAVSSNFDQVNLGEDGVAVTQVSRLQGTGSSVTQQQSAAPRMDTIEISAEGRAASAAAQDQTADSANSLDAYEYEAEDLSEYTDSELKLMYYRGDITLQEYEDETGETIE